MYVLFILSITLGVMLTCKFIGCFEFDTYETGRGTYIDKQKAPRQIEG